MSKLSLKQAKRVRDQDKQNNRLKNQQACLLIEQVYLQKSMDELQAFKYVVNQCKVIDVAIDDGYIAITQENHHKLLLLSQSLFSDHFVIKSPVILWMMGMSMVLPMVILSDSWATFNHPDSLKQLIHEGALSAFHTIFTFLMSQVLLFLWIFFGCYYLGLAIFSFAGVENTVINKQSIKFSIVFLIVQGFEQSFYYKTIKTADDKPAHHYVKATHLFRLERLLLARLNKLQKRLNQSQMQVYVIGEKLNGDK